MKTVINYTELSQILEGNFTFGYISEKEIKISGEINALVFSKKFSMVLGIERVGYSSVDLSTSEPSLVSAALMFLPKKFKGVISPLGEGKIKIDFRQIPEISEIIKKVRLESIQFGEENITIKISPRP